MPTNQQVYIVTKTIDGFTTNEGVFDTETNAQTYIDLRKQAKDRDDIGCTFKIEPWCVQTYMTIIAPH